MGHLLADRAAGRPPLATLGILTFMGNWNSCLVSLVVITSHQKRTLPIVLTWFNLDARHATT